METPILQRFMARQDPGIGDPFTSEAEPAAAKKPERLKRRADFQNVAKGARFHAKGFTLQAAPGRTGASLVMKAEPEGGFAPRIGFTITKKLGGAALRNRIRRRLKEALRQLEPLPARPGHDYVIFARGEALALPFSDLQAELLRAFRGLSLRADGENRGAARGGTGRRKGTRTTA